MSDDKDVEELIKAYARKKRLSYMKEYNKRPEVIAKRLAYQKQYFSKPENKDYYKKQYRKHRTKKLAYMKEYNSRPEVIAKRKEYNSRPEIIARQSAYQKQYYLKKKLEGKT